MSWIVERIKIWFSKSRTCPVEPGTDVILAVIRIVVKTGKGAALFAVAGGPGLFPILLRMSNGSLIKDIITVIKDYDEIPCELAALHASDYATLVQTVMDEFGFSKPEAKRAVGVAIKLIGDVKDNPVHGDG